MTQLCASTAWGTTAPSAYEWLGNARHMVSHTATAMGAIALGLFTGHAQANFVHDARILGDLSRTTIDGGGLLSYARQGLPFTQALANQGIEMNSAIQSFMASRAGADIGAIQKMHQMAIGNFSTPIGLPNVAFEVSNSEDSGPVLFMTLNTHDMDFDEQMRRELAMREAIWSDERLRQAKKYVVISIY